MPTAVFRGHLERSSVPMFWVTGRTPDVMIGRGSSAAITVVRHRDSGPAGVDPSGRGRPREVALATVDGSNPERLSRDEGKVAAGGRWHPPTGTV